MKRASLLVLAAIAFALPAGAQDRRAEQGARDALQGAQADFATGAYGKAITRLRRAARACGRCSVPVRAQIMRDLGAISIQSGDADGGAAAFVDALNLEPNGELTPRYDSAEVRAAWDEAHLLSAAQPTGDFTHTPPAEATAGAALPLSFETDAALAKVTVRYKSSAMREFGRLDLVRSGKRWSGSVPCADVARGVMRYYVVGLDADGSPAATGGDARHPYFVRVRASTGEEKCAGSAPPPAEKPTPAPEEREKKEEKPKPAEDGAFVRLWVGFGASIDLSPLPVANDVCRSQGNPYYCTDPRGNDYPGDPKIALAGGRAGNVSGGFIAGDVRVFVAFDYAINSNLLAGARLGFVTNSYPGDAANKAGHAFSLPLHAEARVTYAFGDAPLAHTGVAPIVLGALGVGRFDASTVVQVAQTGVAGDRPTVAWDTGGPFFAAVGGGARVAFSPRAAFSMVAKASAAFGGAGVFPSFAPEASLQYGF
jgi:hypothetical protein